MGAHALRPVDMLASGQLLLLLLLERPSPWLPCQTSMPCQTSFVWCPICILVPIPLAV